ncbi:MAG: hypothetical protein GY859_32970 [Desulfobacterales bacterium]|nr:hypothetical protein [Desulfobacterales bacterium]
MEKVSPGVFPEDLCRASERPAFACYGAAVFAGALFQEPGVCDGRRPFRFRPGPLFEGRQHLQGRVGLLDPKTWRAGLAGVFGLSALCGPSLHGHLGRIIGLHQSMGQGREPVCPGRRQTWQSR